MSTENLATKTFYRPLGKVMFSVVSVLLFMGDVGNVVKKTIFV